MSVQESLKNLMNIEGALGACVVDYTSGMVLGTAGGGGGLDLELAGAGNAEVVKAKMKVMESLGIEGEIEDILITLEKQFHIIRPTSLHDGLFLYLALEKSRSNLALARRRVHSIEEELNI